VQQLLLVLALCRSQHPPFVTSWNSAKWFLHGIQVHMSITCKLSSNHSAAASVPWQRCRCKDMLAIPATAPSLRSALCLQLQ
jgi:hypothetical protein